MITVVRYHQLSELRLRVHTATLEVVPFCPVHTMLVDHGVDDGAPVPLNPFTIATPLLGHV
jgi:hypothetical protein